MSRHHEPNASYYSARYAERKRAAERARDALGPRPAKCSRVSCAATTTRDHMCSTCRAEYERLRDAGDYDRADAFMAMLGQTEGA